MKIVKRIKGMDISTLLEEERCGAHYYDDGKECDLLDILQKYGVNSVRLRLWNDPYGDIADEKCCEPVGTNGRLKYGAGTNDIDTLIELAGRAKAHGMSVLLDFHYSDFWADPGKQYPPKSWRSLDAQGLVNAVYEYTRGVMQTMKEKDLLPYMVQVGNELTNGCCWPLGSRDYGRLQDRDNTAVPYFNPILKDILTAGITAVRDAAPETIVMIHLDNGGNNALYREWFDGYFACEGAGLLNDIANPTSDFDVIGLSYYPFWHGNLAALESNLNDISTRYRKELVITEVSMGHTMEDYRKYELPEKERENGGTDIDSLKGMATREELVKGLDYPMTPKGQADFMKHIGAIISKVPEELCRGYYYWEPAWIPVPGCGWATEASLEYIHDKGPCGNEWANQALFDYSGNVLEAMKVK